MTAPRGEPGAVRADEPRYTREEWRRLDEIERCAQETGHAPDLIVRAATSHLAVKALCECGCVTWKPS